MNEKENERLFLALGEVGGDLVDLAEHGTFRGSVWRRWGALAACMALVIGLAAVALPMFRVAIPGSRGTQETGKTALEPGTKVQFRYTYYYLDNQCTQQPPADLTTALGTVEESDDETLLDCLVYRKVGATEYTNHSIHGLSVYDQVYIETADGYRLATTYNEKTMSRYTFNEVVASLEQSDTEWILQELVEPLERFAPDVSFEEPAQMTSEQLNRFFFASICLNTGVEVSGQWRTEDSQYRIPAEDVVWRLDRFLTDYTYWPEQTAYYNAGLHALVVPETVLQPQTEFSLEVAEWILEPDTETMILTVNRYADEAAMQPVATRVYEISFHTDSWHYERIADIP